MSENQTENISIAGHSGTWYEVDRTIKNGKTYLLLGHEQQGDETGCLIVDESFCVLFEDCQNGFEKLP